MDHISSSEPPREIENQHLIRRNSRYGLVLFSIYLASYTIFVLINTFKPQLMDVLPWSGVSLAVLYGLGLIGAAFVLAVIYVWLCRSARATPTEEEK